MRPNWALERPGVLSRNHHAPFRGWTRTLRLASIPVPPRRGRLAAVGGWTRALLLALVCLVSGCAAVQPWERDQLSDPIMMFDENPLDVKAKQHHLDYREGSTGATGARGGGCGCG